MEVINVKEAREYVTANYPNDPLLKHIVLNLLDQLPRVPAVKTMRGDWIDGRPYTNSRWKVCSVCHQSAPDPQGGYNFCPNCGAAMGDPKKYV